MGMSMKNKGAEKMFRQNRRIWGGTPACIGFIGGCRFARTIGNTFTFAVILLKFFVQKTLFFIRRTIHYSAQNHYNFTEGQIGIGPFDVSKFCVSSKFLSI